MANGYTGTRRDGDRLTYFLRGREVGREEFFDAFTNRGVATIAELNPGRDFSAFVSAQGQSRGGNQPGVGTATGTTMERQTGGGPAEYPGMSGDLPIIPDWLEDPIRGALGWAWDFVKGNPEILLAAGAAILNARSQAEAEEIRYEAIEMARRDQEARTAQRERLLADPTLGTGGRRPNLTSVFRDPGNVFATPVNREQVYGPVRGTNDSPIQGTERPLTPEEETMARRQITDATDFVRDMTGRLADTTPQTMTSLGPIGGVTRVEDLDPWQRYQRENLIRGVFGR